MLLLLLGFPFGKNISLIYSIVLPGKAVTCPAGLHIHTLCTCPYTQYVYTVYTHTYCVYVNIHSVCMCISAGQVKSIEELPPISQICQRYPPLFYSTTTGESISAASLPVTLHVYFRLTLPLSRSSNPQSYFYLDASFLLPMCYREGVRMLSSHE